MEPSVMSGQDKRWTWAETVVFKSLLFKFKFKCSAYFFFIEVLNTAFLVSKQNGKRNRIVVTY